MKTHNQQTGRWLTYVVLLLTVGGGLVACRENAISDLGPADQAVYITNYDRSVNFSQYKTFSLPDSVVVESNDGYGTASTAISSRFVSNVANGLQARGFQRVAAGQPADLGVAVIRVDNQYTGVGVNSYYLDYWGGGFGGLGGLGGFGYSPFYPSYYTYQVSDQYWEVQIVDLKNRPTTGTGQPQLAVIYNATVRGADITDQSAVDAATTAFFNQSPYLQTSAK